MAKYVIFSRRVEHAFTTEWLQATLATLKLMLWRREIVSSRPDRGNIVGWVLSATSQLVRFSHPNMPHFPNSKFI